MEEQTSLWIHHVICGIVIELLVRILSSYILHCMDHTGVYHCLAVRYNMLLTCWYKQRVNQNETKEIRAVSGLFECFLEDIVTVTELVVFTHCSLTFPNQKRHLETHCFII